jgi:integrase
MIKDSQYDKGENKIAKQLKLVSSVEDKVDQLMIQLKQENEETRDILFRGFIQIYQQNIDLQNQLVSVKKELKIVTKQLQKKIEEERVKEEKQLRRKNRKRLPRREPITRELYEYLIDEANALNYSKSFRGARLRLALVLLLITGARISELLPLRLYQVETLFKKGWIAIDRAKRGPLNHKAFLTEEGKKLLKNRFEDLKQVAYFKTADSFIFTAQDSDQPLQRDAWNRIINSFLKRASEKLDNKPNLRSHSFRIGYITKLWKDTSDLEFIRQVIGHASIDTTSIYVANLSEKERQHRMTLLGKNEPLESPKSASK